MFTGRQRRPDDGFTLVEVVVALVLVSVVMLSAIPALIGVMKSATITRDGTRAKNFAQQRLEQLRDLRFHVDRQNGPFLDLLDIYYTNATSTMPTTTVDNGGTSLTGRFVTSGSVGADEPTAPYYRVTTGDLPGSPGFTQVITAQFLGPTGTAVPASRFQNTYDSQTAGRDEPPSTMLNVTVATYWTQAGRQKVFRTSTRITEVRPERPVIQSQARAIAIDLTSSATDGTTLELQAGLTTIDGAQSSGSSVTGLATGAQATRSGASAVTGELKTFSLPGPGVTTTGATTPTGAPCSWYGFGPSTTTNVNGDVSTGLPKAPSDVDSTTPPKTLGAGLTAGGNPGCGVLSFDNLASGAEGKPLTDPLGAHMGAGPYARISSTTGNAELVQARAYVSSNDIAAAPQKTVSGAQVALTRELVLFPNSPDTIALGTGLTGLVRISLTSAAVDCVSGSTSTAGTVTGSYTGLTLRWWGRGPADQTARWHSATWSYNSATAAAPVLASGSDVWDPANTDLGGGVPLSAVVSGTVPSATSGVLSEGASNGLRGFPQGVLTMSTASTQVTEAGPGYSSIKVQIGQLSCVADDER